MSAGRSSDYLTRPLAFVQDVLARIVFVRESTDPAERERALADLEHDLAEEVERLKADPYRRVTLDDFNTIEGPA